MTIAQPFKVGCACPKQISPEGTAESRVLYESSVSRPFGTYRGIHMIPNLERLGYSRTSLREIRLMAAWSSQRTSRWHWIRMSAVRLGARKIIHFARRPGDLHAAHNLSRQRTKTSR